MDRLAGILRAEAERLTDEDLAFAVSPEQHPELVSLPGTPDHRVERHATRSSRVPAVQPDSTVVAITAPSFVERTAPVEDAAQEGERQAGHTPASAAVAASETHIVRPRTQTSPLVDHQDGSASNTSNSSPPITHAVSGQGETTPFLATPLIAGPVLDYKQFQSKPLPTSDLIHLPPSLDLDRWARFTQKPVESLFVLDRCVSKWRLETVALALNAAISIYYIVNGELGQDNLQNAGTQATILVTLLGSVLVSVSAIFIVLSVRAMARTTDLVSKLRQQVRSVLGSGDARTVSASSLGPPATNILDTIEGGGVCCLSVRMLMWWMQHLKCWHVALAFVLPAVGFNAQYIAWCSQENIDELCAGYESGRYPLPPSLAVLASCVALSVFVLDVPAGAGAATLAFVPLVVQSALFYPSIDTGSDGPRIWDSALVAVLLTACYLGTVVAIVDHSFASRRAFALNLSVQQRFTEYAKAVAAWHDTQAVVSRARESAVQAKTAQIVSEAAIGYAAHQLRNPLHLLSCMVEDLEERVKTTAGAATAIMTAPESSIADWSDMRAAIAHMIRVTENALEMQQLMSARVPVRPRRSSLRYILSKHTRTCAMRYRRDVTLTIAASVPKRIITDVVRLEQMFVNGLANALEAVPAPHAGGWVDVHVYLVLAPPVPKRLDGKLMPVTSVPGRPISHLEPVRHTLTAPTVVSTSASRATTTSDIHTTPSMHAVETADGAATQHSDGTSSQRSADITPQGNFRPYLHIEIINTGPGLRGMSAHALFSPFEARKGVETFSPTRLRMVGLGLSIVRLAAQLMHARIGLKDAPNPEQTTAAPNLTRYFIELPIRAAVDATESPLTLRTPLVGAGEVHPQEVLGMSPVSLGAGVAHAGVAAASEGQLEPKREAAVTGVQARPQPAPLETVNLATSTSAHLRILSSDSEWFSLSPRAPGRDATSPACLTDRQDPQRATLDQSNLHVRPPHAAGTEWWTHTFHAGAWSYATDSHHPSSRSSRDAAGGGGGEGTPGRAPSSAARTASHRLETAIVRAQGTPRAVDDSSARSVQMQSTPPVLRSPPAVAAAAPAAAGSLHVSHPSSLPTLRTTTGAISAPLPFLGVRVLTVDDERGNLKVNQRMLARLGCTSDVADDGDTAIRLVADSEGMASGLNTLPAVEEQQHVVQATPLPYDVILMDIVMRRVHGDEACEVLRKQYGWSKPIIAATGNATAADRERYMSAGFNAVLSKPFTAEDIRHAFHTLGITPASAPPAD